MNETALDRFWQLLGWVLALKFEAFEQINTLPHGSTVALVVLAASLSQVVAQSVILFINRVKPVRFVFSLLIGAVLFAFGYIPGSEYLADQFRSIYSQSSFWCCGTV